MAFLRREGEETGRIAGARVFLRYPEARDFNAWAALRAESRDFLQPWEPTWPDDELSIASFRYKLRRYAHDIRDGKAYPFFVFRAEDGQLVGGATLSQVRRGAAQAATLGYWVGAPFQNRGFTTDGAIAIARFAFDELDLHRVEAACQPENTASRRVLAKAGFAEEGHARAYLKINGAWRDHVLFGKVRDS